MKNLNDILNEINKEKSIDKIINLIVEMSIIREALLQRKKKLAIFNVVTKACNRIEAPSK